MREDLWACCIARNATLRHHVSHVNSSTKNISEETYCRSWILTPNTLSRKSRLVLNLFLLCLFFTQAFTVPAFSFLDFRPTIA